MIRAGIPGVSAELAQGRSLFVGVDPVDRGPKQDSVHLDGKLLALQNARANVRNVTLLELHCRTPKKAGAEDQPRLGMLFRPFSIGATGVFCPKLPWKRDVPKSRSLLPSAASQDDSERNMKLP